MSADRETPLDVGGEDAEAELDRVSDLPMQDEEIALRLAAGETHEKIAKAMALSTKTIQRRLRNPEFAAVVFDLHRQRMAEMTRQLTAAAPTAMDALNKIVGSGTPTEQIRAASAILQHSRRFHHDGVVEHLVLSVLPDLEARIRDTTTAREGRR